MSSPIVVLCKSLSFKGGEFKVVARPTMPEIKNSQPMRIVKVIVASGGSKITIRPRTIRMMLLVEN
jgi:hypothetical protein